MNGAPSILVIARPGNDRSSLAALLKTLRRAQLFLHDGRGPLPAALHPDLVMIDLGSLEGCSPEMLVSAVRQWPTARCLALVSDVRQTTGALALGAHCALSRDACAGELLQTVQRLTTAPVPLRTSQPAHAAL
jgi:DNA-binding NarL/FixJ family response regulator